MPQSTGIAAGTYSLPQGHTLTQGHTPACRRDIRELQLARAALQNPERSYVLPFTLSGFHNAQPFTPSTCHHPFTPSTCHHPSTCHQSLHTLHMPPIPPHATKQTPSTCHQGVHLSTLHMPPNQHATKPTPSTCHQGVHLSTLLSSRPRHPEFRQRGPFTISSCHNTQPLIPCCQVPPSSEQVPPSSEQCNSSAPFFPAAHAIQIFNRGDLSQHPASHTLLPGATKLRAGATKLRAVNHFSTLLSSRPRYPELRQEDHQDAHASFKTPMLRSSRPCFVQAAHAIQSYDKKTIKPDKRTVTLNQKPPLTVLPCRPLPVGVGKGLT